MKNTLFIACFCLLAFAAAGQRAAEKPDPKTHYTVPPSTIAKADTLCYLIDEVADIDGRLTDHAECGIYYFVTVCRTWFQDCEGRKYRLRDGSECTHKYVVYLTPYEQ